MLDVSVTPRFSHGTRPLKRRARRLVLRSERCTLMRRMLIEALGGRCIDCGSRRRLEPDHVLGCTWDQRRAGHENRLRRFAEEFRAGVLLVARCRSHNGRRNQAVVGTRRERGLADVIDEVEALERAA